MKKARDHALSSAFLVAYRAAALTNAAQLLAEARVLLANQHFARAYFLAIASLEETGKAYLAFTAQGRNLSDGGLSKRLKEIFEDHSQKISSAFVCWIRASSDQRAALKVSVDLMIHLKRGREKSMYVDAAVGDGVSQPSLLVKERQAIDATGIAAQCLKHTQDHLGSNEPPRFSAIDDKLLCIKNARFLAMFNEADFGEYLLDRITREGASFNFNKAAVTYHDLYFRKKRSFAKQASS
jgi:AbiV family abortive infection protein